MTVYGSEEEMRLGLGCNKGTADDVIDWVDFSDSLNDTAFKARLSGFVVSSAAGCVGRLSFPEVSRRTIEGTSEKSESFLPVMVVSDPFTTVVVGIGPSSCACRLVNATTASSFGFDRPVSLERKMGCSVVPLF